MVFVVLLLYSIIAFQMFLVSLALTGFDRGSPECLSMGLNSQNTLAPKSLCSSIAAGLPREILDVDRWGTQTGESRQA